VSELETRLRGFIRDCSRCSLGMFRQGSLDRCGKCGHSYGRGHLGRRDGRDRSTMTARRHCRTAFRGNRGVARVGGCFAGARADESLTDTAGPTLKVRGRARPFKTACRALVRDFAFPSSSSSRAFPLLLEFFRIRNATALALPARPRLRYRDVELDTLQRFP
jgi:hypothetical protein